VPTPPRWSEPSPASETSTWRLSGWIPSRAPSLSSRVSLRWSERSGVTAPWRWSPSSTACREASWRDSSGATPSGSNSPPSFPRTSGRATRGRRSSSSRARNHSHGSGAPAAPRRLSRCCRIRCPPPSKGCPAIPLSLARRTCLPGHRRSQFRRLHPHPLRHRPPRLSPHRHRHPRLSPHHHHHHHHHRTCLTCRRCSANPSIPDGKGSRGIPSLTGGSGGRHARCDAPPLEQ